MNYDEFIKRQWNLCLTLNLLQTLLSGNISAFVPSVGETHLNFYCRLMTCQIQAAYCLHLKALLWFGQWILFILLLR